MKDRASCVMRRVSRRVVRAVLAAVAVGFCLNAVADTLPSNAYVQKGLYHQWDGIDNAGTGTHDATKSVWKDLAGTQNFSFEKSDTQCFNGGNSLYSSGKIFAATTTTIAGYRTIEAGWKSESTSGGCLVFHSGKAGKYVGDHYGSKLVIFSNNTAPTVPYATACEDRFVAATYDESDTLARAFGDGVESTCTTTAGIANPTDTPNCFALGWFANNHASQFSGRYYFCRLYNRVLAPAEIAYNHAVDCNRYKGVAIEDAPFPDCMRYNQSLGRIEYCQTVSFDATKGTVSVDGQTAEPGAIGGWHAYDEDVEGSVTLAATAAKGYAFVRWEGVPDGVDATSETIVLPKNVPASVTATFAFYYLPSSGYALKGCVAQYDGIDNQATGEHVASATKWKTLVSGAYDLSRGDGDFSTDLRGFTCAGGNGMLAGSGKKFADYQTIEFGFRQTATGTTCAMHAGVPGRYVVFDSSNEKVTFSSGSGVLAVPGKTNELLFVGATFADSAAATKTVDSVFKSGQDVRGVTQNLTWTGDPQQFLFNWSGGSGKNPFYGTFYACRLYNRRLTPAEIAYNYAVDCNRYKDAAVEDAPFPACMRYNRSLGRIEYCQTVDFNQAEGSVTVDGVAVEPGALSAWTAYDDASAEGEITLTATAAKRGYTVCWEGLPDGSQSPMARTIRLPRNLAVSVRATFVRNVLPSGAYVKDGLYHHWDGIDNAGTGTHDATKSVWKDLAGTQNLSFEKGDTQCFDGGNSLYSSGKIVTATTTTIDGYRTIEAGWKSDSASGSCMVFHSGKAGKFVGDHYTNKRVIFKRNTAPTIAYATACEDRFVTATYDDSDVLARAYDAGVESKDTTTASIAYDTTTPKCFALGWYADNAVNRFSGRYYFCRLYNRELTPTEIAYNAAVDQNRYKGVDFEDLPFPSTMRYSMDDARVEVCQTVTFDATKGGVTVDDEEVESGWANAWTTYDDEGTVVLQAAPKKGCRFLRWEGLPDDVDATAATVELPRNAGCGAVAVFADGTPASTVYAAREALTHQWDGIDNAGTGTHDATARIWKDLAGAQNFSFTKDATLYFDGGNALYSSGRNVTVTTTTIAGYRTIEAGWKSESTSGGCLVFHSGKAGKYVGDHYTGKRVIFRNNTAPTIAYATVCEDRFVAATYDEEDALARAYDAGVESKDEAKTSIAYDTSTPNCFALGWFADGHASKFNGLYYFCRLYSRELTPVEIAYNAAIDRWRFAGDAVPFETLVMGEQYADRPISFVRGDPAVFGRSLPAYGITFREGSDAVTFKLSGTKTYADGVAACVGDDPVRERGKAKGYSLQVGTAAATTGAGGSVTVENPEGRILLTWLFDAQYRVTIAVADTQDEAGETVKGGSVRFDGADGDEKWFDAGATVRLIATPDAKFRVAGWYDALTGEKLGSGSEFVCTADAGRDIVVKFKVAKGMRLIVR